MGAKKRKRGSKAASQTHRVSKSYINGRRWVVTEQPKEQELPAVESGKHWTVIRVGIKREGKTEVRLKASGLTTFVPRYVRIAVRGRERRDSEPVLVPGYVFVCSTCSEEEQAKIMGLDVIDLRRALEWHDPRTGERYSTSVRPPAPRTECVMLRNPHTGQPIRIPEKVMAKFVGRVSQATKQASGAVAPVTFAPGASARVIDGPFASFLAEVEAVDNGLAKVLIEIFGRKSQAELPIAALEPA